MQKCVLFLVMNHRTCLRLGIGALGAAVLTACAAAQDPATIPAGPERLDFESHLGSFKIYNADGVIKFSFKGTVLIRDYKGQLTVSPGLKKEYEGHGRTVYFGAGEISLNGHWTSMQWLGRDLSGTWNGRGGFRFYGDYDKDLQTGFYWYDGNEKSKAAWPTQGFNMILPQPRKPSNMTPVLKNKGG
jgi:hypothetical protein